MPACDPQTLLSESSCLGAQCLTASQQAQIALGLLYRWSGTTKTVQQLLDESKCLGAQCLGKNQQVQIALALLCEIATAAPPVVCFTLEMSSTPSLGASNGTATATPVGGVGPFTYLWNNGATTQTITGLDGNTVWHCTVTDTGAPTCIVEGDVTVNATTLIYSGGSQDPQLSQWTVTGNLYQSGNDVYASTATSSVVITTVNLDGQFSLSGLSATLQHFSILDSSITSIDLSGCAALQTLDVDGSLALTSIDVSECTGLIQLYVSRCPLMTSLNTQNLTLLEWLSCFQNATMTFLNIENCSALYSITAYSSAFQTLMVFNNPALGSVSGFFVDFTDNALDSGSVDGFLVYFDSLGTTPPITNNINLSGGTNAAPSGAGATAATNILGRGWNLNTN
jgi:hypothetical protein